MPIVRKRQPPDACRDQPLQQQQCTTATHDLQTHTLSTIRSYAQANDAIKAPQHDTHWKGLGSASLLAAGSTPMS